MKESRIALVASLSILLAGCVGDRGNDSTAEREGQVVKAVGEKNMLTAMEEVADSGKGFGLKDATTLGRYIYNGRPREYVVCFEKDVPDLQAVDLYVVPVAERCPARLGAEIPTPQMPTLIGNRVEATLLKVLMAGYYPKRIEVFKVDSPARAVDPKPLANWYICMQEPDGGTAFNSSNDVKLYAAKKCP